MYIETKEIGPEGLIVERVIEVRTPIKLAGNETIQAAPAHLDGELLRESEGISFTGDIETVATLTCSRCLEPYALPLDLHFDLLYTAQPEAVDRGESRMDADEVTRTHFDGRRIDLDQLLEEQIYLAVPLKPLCRPDCRGLCPRCGANLNQSSCNCREERVEDSRFLELKKLL
jgi:DUF177 domain-containing protein